MYHRRVAAALVLALSTVSAIAGPEAPRVVCVSGHSVKTGCKGAMQRLDQDLFLKRWPTDHAIFVITQSIRPKYANIAVDAGTLYVVKIVRNGKEHGYKPVWVVQAADDTNNLSDGAPEELVTCND